MNSRDKHFQQQKWAIVKKMFILIIKQKYVCDTKNVYS